LGSKPWNYVFQVDSPLDLLLGRLLSILPGSKVEKIIEAKWLLVQRVLFDMILLVICWLSGSKVTIDLFFVIPAAERRVKSLISVSSHPLSSNILEPRFTDRIMLADDTENTL
jgi:hypothetical protein